MEDKNIPYIAVESMLTRQERTIKRLWIVALILIAALIGSNIGWVYYESQFQIVESTTQTVEQEITADGYSNVTNTGVGDVNVSACEAESNAD